MSDAKDTGPIRPTDHKARALARGLIDTASFCALGVIDPDSDAPFVTRIALATDSGGQPISLISDIAFHTQALKANPACSLLVGEPDPKGNPLVHPRLTLSCVADPVACDAANRSALRDHYLTQHPKAKLYADFADFNFVRFRVTQGFLNGGFGQAFKLTAADLGL